MPERYHIIDMDTANSLTLESDKRRAAIEYLYCIKRGVNALIVREYPRGSFDTKNAAKLTAQCVASLDTLFERLTMRRPKYYVNQMERMKRCLRKH